MSLKKLKAKPQDDIFQSEVIVVRAEWARAKEKSEEGMRKGGGRNGSGRVGVMG